MSELTSHRIFIALGSNLGDRPANIREALKRLEQGYAVQIDRVSTFLDNPAVGGPADSPPYLNAVAAVRTLLLPDALMQRLLDIERDLGRVRAVRWEPRLIDLDLLLYDDMTMRSESLTLPHPLLHMRPFVLKPLAEIAPDAIHPVLKRTIVELWNDLSSANGQDAKTCTLLVSKSVANR